MSIHIARRDFITLLGAAAHRWLVSCGLSFLPAATSRQNVSIRSCQLGTMPASTPAFCDGSTLDRGRNARLNIE